MTIPTSVPSPPLLQLWRLTIRQIIPAAIVFSAVMMSVAVGDGFANVALTLTVFAAIAGAYRLGRSVPGHEASAVTDTDDLTGLPNRSEFFNALRDRLAGGSSSDLTVGLISLDGFSSINDAHGHCVGDRILKNLAARLERITPEAFVGYLGGDEFGFFIRADLMQARALAEAVRELAASPYEIADLRLRVGCSGGLAVVQGGRDTGDALFDRAHYALRSAKVSNVGGVTVYDEDLKRRARQGPAIEEALETCDPAREMSILFQPIYDLDAGRTTSVEALARWTSPKLGAIPPDVFIAAAERLGFIHTITLALLRKTLSELDRLPEGIDVSFNLSAHDITDSRTVMAIAALMREMGVDPCRIIFEITETAMMRNFEVAADTVRLFRSLGARVALDDFGSGYSSLGYLHRMAFDKVKIDRSFIAEVERNEGRRLLASIVGLCRNLELGCIVEGVETPEQLAIVHEIGCRAYQGYLLSRPMAPDELLAWLRSPSVAAVRMVSNPS